ncbi:MAG: hypothetical protein IPM40_21345 [Gammaproteobacteria bacterium]|nr:hypothetical protein [Gammaproteobacteria bacterium]
MSGRRARWPACGACAARVTAVGDLVPLAGMNALQREDPFALAWQDLNAAAAHYSVSPLQLAEQDGRDIAARAAPTTCPSRRRR